MNRLASIIRNISLTCPSWSRLFLPAGLSLQVIKIDNWKSGAFKMKGGEIYEL